MNPYQVHLEQLDDWVDYLTLNSHLPGPRANLELAYVAGNKADQQRALALIALDENKPAGDSPQVFPILCGIIALARLSGENPSTLNIVREYANDLRWRLREAVAIGFQFRGDRDLSGLLVDLESWLNGSMLEKRAVVAALCEPRLLQGKDYRTRILQIIDHITASLLVINGRKSDDYRVLRQALGYGWSVALASDPNEGKPFFEKWLTVNDPDIRWMLRENLKKNRLTKMDAAWVLNCLSLLDKSAD